MAQTLAEKIIAKACGRDKVAPGEIVTCTVDLAMIHDSGGPRRAKPAMEKLGVRVWDARKIVLVSDHFSPCTDAESAGILKLTREWAAEQGIVNFYDQQGICHVVTPERGHLRPGMFAVGGDSHSPTGGAFGCYMFGVGATDMLGILVTGETWIRVPETICINWAGKLGRGVSAKDMALKLCATLGMDGGGYHAIQYCGDGVRSLDMFERMTLCNMAAELGAQAGLIEADETTVAYIKKAGGDPGNWRPFHSDAAAKYEIVHDFSGSDLAPQVAVPHSPATAADVDLVEKAEIDQFYIGACTGAKLNDLEMAAAVLKGKKVAKGRRLTVAPASSQILNEATKSGVIGILLDAGAGLLPPGCGACAGYGVGVLAEDEVCLATTARNFQGRMGASSSRVYLASPYTVAASAVAGHILDPREVLSPVSGRVWKFGDDVNTDVLAPGIYIKLPPEALAKHCLESVRPDFAKSVQAGDFVVAGKNFGTGSSREQAAQSLKVLGVAVVIAPSFGGIFYRNAFNFGLPAIVSQEIDGIEDGHKLSIDLAAGRIVNETTGRSSAAQGLPENLMALIEAGGLVPYLERKLGARR